MAQLTIHIDDKIAREINKASRKAGLSQSEWVSRVIKKELHQKLPDRFFQILGTWEDDRKPEEIIKEIRAESTRSCPKNHFGHPQHR